MIAGVAQVNAGSNYYRLGSVYRQRSASYPEKTQPTDRWIPGGSDEPEGYEQIGAKPGLTADEQAQVDQLKRRDREVRQHEQAHAAVLGSYAMGGPVYQYQVGPDGRAYAVGGSIKVDMSSTGNERVDAAKAMKIKAAASAGGDMSTADMNVAMSASKGLGLSLEA